MTYVRAQLKRLRIAPRKVRLVGNLIKGMEVGDAQTQLAVTVKRSSDPVLKLLKSAVANARNNSKIPDSEPLFVKDVRIDEGPVYKRFMPRARGRASAIRKKTSHITITLETKTK